MPDIGVARCKGAEPDKATYSVAHRSGKRATLLTQLTENIIQDSGMSINLGAHYYNH
jgi:hypothetical protein